VGGTETSDSAGFSSLIARVIRDGSVPPAICVFPNGGRSGYRGSVEKMIVEELIPLIDTNYPTNSDVKSRAVAGFSMGVEFPGSGSSTRHLTFVSRSHFVGGVPSWRIPSPFTPRHAGQFSDTAARFIAAISANTAATRTQRI
jgi:hypothetical protein